MVSNHKIQFNSLEQLAKVDFCIGPFFQFESRTANFTFCRLTKIMLNDVDEIVVDDEIRHA